MWLGTIMWFNVWFLIWPNQQKALNIGGKFSDLAAPDKAAAAKTEGHPAAGADETETVVPKSRKIKCPLCSPPALLPARVTTS